MNNIKKIPLFLAVIFTATSCTLSKTEWVPLEDFSGLDPKMSFIPYSSGVTTCDEQSFLDGRLVGGERVRDVLEQEDDGTKTTHTSGATIMKGLISSWGNAKIRSYSGTYYSIDQHGDSLLLSGRIVLPADGKVSRIMLVSHYTIGADFEAPSNELPLESIYAARGIAVLESDYIGYGASADRVHPYLCAALTARNVVDMYFAALPFLKKIGCSPAHDDIFLLGYSQGGATTLSAAYELEHKHPDVKIRLAMCGGGPYDVCATYDALIDRDFTDYPCAVPMIVQGFNAGEDLHLDYSDFFLPPVLKNMDEWLNSKKYPMAEITRMMGTKKLSEIMTVKARNKSEDLMTDLYKAMLDNSVVSFPVPKCPKYMFHSYDDNVVPYINMVSEGPLLEDGGNNVIFNVGHYGNHVAGCLRFLLCCMDLMETHGDV